jgi:hypothetical protein
MYFAYIKYIGCDIFFNLLKGYNIKKEKPKHKVVRSTRLASPRTVTSGTPSIAMVLTVSLITNQL